MKAYRVSQITDYGDIAAITAVSGAPFTGDFNYDVNGTLTDTGMDSLSNCPVVQTEGHSEQSGVPIGSFFPTCPIIP